MSVEPTENLSRVSSTGRFVVLRQDSKNVNDYFTAKSKPTLKELSNKETKNGRNKIKLGVSSYVDKDTCESAV